MYLFSVVFTPPSPSHGSVWLLHVTSLLLTNTVSPVRTCPMPNAPHCPSIWLERFCGSQREDERGPLSIQSSLVGALQFSASKRTWRFQHSQPGTVDGNHPQLFHGRMKGITPHFSVLLFWSVPALQKEERVTERGRRAIFAVSAISCMAGGEARRAKWDVSNKECASPTTQPYTLHNVVLLPCYTGGQGVPKRCRLSWLINSALVYEPKCGGLRGLSQWVQ